jgi:uncharacterized membrane protein YadS
MAEFDVGFLLVSELATAGIFTEPRLGKIANLSRWAFLLTFAGAGSQTNIRARRRRGLRFLVTAAVGEFAIAGVALLLLLVA